MLIKLRNKWINPVLGKEFRLRMRHIRSPLAIMFYLLAIGLVGLGYLYVTTEISGSAAGFNPSQSRVLFYVLSIAQLVLIAFMTPGLTAGVISGEREKQTLNMLLTTQQSSTTIILSKLVSALSFMLLVVLATMPLYAIVFLFGGISPKQLFLVFLFYVFTMLVIGSFGVLFSTLLKRTMISVISTYGVTLFLFAGTGIIYLFVQQIINRSNYGNVGTKAYEWTGFILALNPVAALISVFEPSFSDSVFRGRTSNLHAAPLQLWQIFGIVFTVLAALAILLSIRYIRPVLKKHKA
ncbi:MAG: ABC transporter permease [Gorillibacterium sp.]|nr:ABC transporter permease [Gorillibacterium sp.]